jgi:hypothetical protein
MGEIHFLPPDLRNKAANKGGMNKAELKSMRGAFRNVENVKACDVRTRPEGEKPIL